jgi:hypothetical protein
MKGMDNMKKKRLISIPLAVVLTMVTAVAVLAGSTSDIGTLHYDPPAGSANWTAWAREWDDSGEFPVQIYPPTLVLTEDNSNAAAGENLGYTDAGWFIQVENLPTAVRGSRIYVSFGGLTDFSGSHWYYSFPWDVVSESETDHGEVPITTEEGPVCPTIYPVITHTDELYNEVRFWGSPNTTYHVYLSTTPSAAGNEASNGRYNLWGSATTDASGMGVYYDNYPGITDDPAWYLIIYFGDNPTLGGQGCHSEPVSPNSATLTNFTASYDLLSAQVNLSWETTNQIDMLGFNVLRQAPGEQAPTQINQEIIYVYQPGSSMGGVFGFVDTDVVFGSDYQYWIEVVETDNLTSRFGPVGVTSGYNVFIPLMKK